MTPAPPKPQAAAACTIISPNYLPFARTLAQSYRAHHPTHQFFVLIVASATDPTPFLSPDYQTILVGDLPLENLRREAMKFDLLELNTNVKPTFMKHLLRPTYSLETLSSTSTPTYSSTPRSTPVFAALDQGASRRPHPPHDRPRLRRPNSPSEQDHPLQRHLQPRLHRSCAACTESVSDPQPGGSARCLDLGFSEGRTGLFVDQKWMNLAPGLFPHVQILRHPGCNMAYWNLHERRVTTYPARTLTGSAEAPTVNNTVPLCFFHFSGITPDDPASLSKYTNRFTLADRPDLQPLFAAYKSTLLANSNRKAEAVPYGFDQLSDGTAVTRLARRIYAGRIAEAQQARSVIPTGAAGAVGEPALPTTDPTRQFPNLSTPGPFANHDPFDAHGPFAAFARRHRLVAGKLAPAKSTWREFNPTDRRVQAVHRLLKLALRVLGPNRYELLMRYLAHIAVLRNQSTFLGKD